MKITTKIARFLLAGVLVLAACTVQVGSDQWCADMKATPTGDWSANQALDFAKLCILK